MARYKFSAAERYAVFTVHNEKCWLCGEPIGLLETEVDHVIPETLIGNAALATVLTGLGLQADFEINSFANWMPAHRRCNGEKSDTVFRSSPLIQLKLQSAIDRADRAEALYDEYLSDRKISRAINILLAAQEFGGFAERHKKMMERLITTVEQEHEPNREQEERGKPLFLAPWLEVVHEDERWITLRGPGGLVGMRPKTEQLHPSWDCPRCGFTGWNGARCISCGMLDDGD